MSDCENMGQQLLSVDIMIIVITHVICTDRKGKLVKVKAKSADAKTSVRSTETCLNSFLVGGCDNIHKNKST